MTVDNALVKIVISVRDNEPYVTTTGMCPCITVQNIMPYHIPTTIAQTRSLVGLLYRLSDWVVLTRKFVV